MQIVSLLVVLLVACAVAMPEAPLKRVFKLQSRTDVRDSHGQIAHSYAIEDGTRVSEQGALKPTADAKDYVLVKTGEYSYTSPDGTPIMVKYTADENGFRAEGKHLPVSVVA